MIGRIIYIIEFVKCISVLYKKKDQKTRRRNIDYPKLDLNDDNILEHFRSKKQLDRSVSTWYKKSAVFFHFQNQSVFPNGWCCVCFWVHC